MKLLLIASISAFALAGCASVPKDGGVAKVEAILNAQTGAETMLPKAGRDRLSPDAISTMLKKPLKLEDAESLALELNPAVRAQLAQVGVAESDYAQAARMENPGISFERFSSKDYAASALFDLGGIFLMPLKRGIEKQRLERSRFEAAIGVMDHVAGTRQAWFEAVTSKQTTALIERSVLAAETSNTLTRQMAAIGHSSVREAATSQSFVSEMRAMQLKQQQAEMAAREKLIRRLGLWGEQARNLKLPDALPPLPEDTLQIVAVEREAIERRLDVQLAKANLESMAANMKLSRRNPFLSAIEFGPVLESADGDRERGYEIELRLPIFDTGAVQGARNRALFSQALANAESVAIAAASQAREAIFAYQISWDIANNMQSVVMPLRQRLTEENMLEYNGMLISVFDLLTDVRAATQTEINYVNAIRDFWLADTALQQAMTGAGMESSAMMGSGSNAPQEAAAH